MNKLLDKFRLPEKEPLPAVIAGIDKGVVFRGANLWALIFAILVASLGLNVNSTAVIIGAMLISPLMGPIMGIGLSMGTSDFELLQKSFYNYSIATAVALGTSTLFFLVSPLNDAHSEILARTSPNIYDVLIALTGGLAGALGTTSSNKGNIIPGVAIATALMPPLCTAGYGVATLQWKFFLGAFYLYIINTVFIALATFILIRVLYFPVGNISSNGKDRVARHIVWPVVLLTLLPSIYFGYDMIQQEKFSKNANRFIQTEAALPDNYMLNKDINKKVKTITLIYGGKKIADEDIQRLKRRTAYYGIDSAALNIRQGFSLLPESKLNESDEKLKMLMRAFEQKEKKEAEKIASDSTGQGTLARQLFQEIKVQYPGLQQATIQEVLNVSDSNRAAKSMLALLRFNNPVPESTAEKIAAWLKVRLQYQNIQLIIQP
ncbi:MAG TPA: DUF389 domain-containing protein [Ferruginibacter sp.]|nr:DUF389 domain-containing protein [Ferruginibacter sp.]HMP21532.1 DUF389 domain-containing protein [Ferruginibacter sp.]